MTTVKVFKRHNHITGIECDGHTDYGEEGEDIVCAALSSVVQTALLGLLQVAGINADYKRDEAYLSIRLPEGLDERQRRDAEVILNTMYLGVADLNEGFSKYIKLEIRTEVK